jgi:dipeptidyl aminopeptidase/acylaminoacyl peptidase
MSDGLNKEYRALEQQLETMRRKLPVNRSLEKSLRTQLRAAPRAKRSSPWMALIAVAAMIALLIGSTDLLQLGPHAVLAAELQIVEQFPFIDLISGNYGIPAVDGDTLYLPVSERGIYRYDTTAVISGEGLTSILEQPGVSWVAINHAGDQLAYTLSTGVYLYHLVTGECTTLIEGDDATVYYETPIWSSDDQSLIMARREIEWLEHGHRLRELAVVEVSLADAGVEKLTDGGYPSLSPDGSLLAFEREGQLWMRALQSQSVWPFVGLKAGQERQLGEGRFPRISPDGSYLVYVGTAETSRQLEDGKHVVEQVSDVYVANLQNMLDRKQITANYADPLIDVNEWVAKAQPKETLNLTGHYDYYNPVWGSDAESLYLLKGEGEKSAMRLCRVSLAQAGLTASEVAAKWLDAVSNRDDDTARRLMSSPTEVLTTSNPHPIGYDLLGLGSENGRQYVDALQFVAYTAQPWYQVRSLRIYLQPAGKSFLVEQVEEISDVQLYERNGHLYREQKGTAEQLLATGEMLNAGETLGAVSYDAETGKAYLAIHQGQTCRIISYHPATNQVAPVFTLSGCLTTSLSVSGEFLAINFAQRLDGEYQNRALLFSLSDQMPVQTMGRSSQAYWADEKLTNYTERDGQLVRWQYDPATAASSLWP